MMSEIEIKQLLEEENLELDQHYAKMDKAVFQGFDFAYSCAKDAAVRSIARIELIKQILQIQ